MSNCFTCRLYADGTRALVIKFNDHKVSLLDINERTFSTASSNSGQTQVRLNCCFVPQADILRPIRSLRPRCGELQAAAASSQVRVAGSGNSWPSACS